MKDLSLKLVINAVVDNARAGLAQTQGYIKGLADQAVQLTGKVGAVSTQFILFASIAANALGQASMAVLGLIGNIVTLGMQLLRVMQNYLGLSISIDTHNKKLQAAQFLLNNFHKEVRLSLGFLGSFADYLNKINFPLQKLTAFIDGLSKAEIVLGIGKGKEKNLFDHLPEAIDAAKNGIKRFQDAFKSAKDDIQRDLKRFTAAALAETVVEWRGVKFESAFADVKKTVTGTVEAIKELRGELLDMAATTGLTTDELAKMQATAGQLGFPVNEISDFVKLTAKGAVAFELLPEQAAEAFGNLKNIYGLNLRELEFLGDQINYIADKANTNESELLAVMNESGGTAQRFGLLRGESIALAAAMLSLGKAPDVVSTAFNMLLGSLQNAQNQSKDFKEGLQLLGLDAKTLADNIEKNPKKALDDFLVSLSKLSPKSQTDILSRLVGNAGESKEVIGDLISKIGEYNRLTELSKSADIGGSMDAAYKERIKTVKAMLVMMKEAWDGVAVSMSAMFLPTIYVVLESLRDLAIWLRKVNDEHQNLLAFSRIALIFGTLGTVMSLAFRALPGIAAGAGAAVAAAFRTGIVSGIKAIATALTPLVAGLWNTVIGQFVIKMLAGVVIIQVGMSNLLGVIGALTSALVALVSNPATLFLSTLGVVAARMALARGAFGALGVAAGGLGTAFMRLVGGPIGLAISTLAFLVVKYNEAKDQQFQFGDSTVTLSEIIDASWGLIKSVFNDGVTAVGSALAWLEGKWQGLWQGIEGKVGEFPSLGQSFKNLANTIIGVFNGLGKSIGVSLAIFVEEIKTSFKHAVSLAEAAAKDIKAAFTHFDFTGKNFAEQWAANNQENQTIAQRRGESPRTDAFVSGYMGSYKGDAIGPFVSRLGDDFRSGLDAAGNAVTSQVGTWQDQLNAEIMRNRIKNTQPTTALPEEKRLSGGQDLPDMPTATTAAAKKLAAANLEVQLSTIKTQQDALKNASDLELKQLENTFKAKELALKEQDLSETEQREKSLSLEKDKSAQELAIKRKLVLDSAALESQAIDAKIKAAQAEASTLSKAAGATPVGKYSALFNQATQKYDLPAGLLPAQAAQESAGDINAVSPKGAGGLMQLMPATAKRFGVTDVNDPAQSIDAAGKYMRFLLDKFNGNVEHALAAYNSGEGRTATALKATGKIPAIPETQAYVPAVLGRMNNATLGTATGAGGDTEEQQAANAKIKTLKNERIALEADTQATLASIDQDAVAKGIELDTAKYENDKRVEEQDKALAEENLTAQSQAALDELDIREAAAQQELDLGNITESEHLDKLRGFARERLAIELQLLADKRKLLDKDALALAQNLHEKEALERAYQQKVQQLDNDAENNKRAIFEGLVAPFKNAMSQMTNGVLTGQQTISNAVRNAANSVLVSYASTFLQERAMAAAQWAWKLANIQANSAQEKAIKNGDVIWAAALWAGDKARLAAHWAWEKLGFGEKEAAKVTTKAGSELAQAGAVVAGQTLQTGATIAGAETRTAVETESNAKSGLGAAWRAAKSAFASVMDVVPFPFNLVLAPIAGAAAFTGVMALGSAKDGEWSVDKDESPFLLHRKESVLPAGVAENFRSVVDIVKSHVGIGKAESSLSAPVAVSIKQLIDSGQLHGNWTLPASVMNIAQKSQATAVDAVKNGRLAVAQRNASNASHTTHNVTHESPIVFQPVYNNSFIDTNGAKKFFNEHAHIMVNKIQEKVRKGAFGAGANK
ncbi:MAG: phage tail tape measure protein [Methylovulum sp.]|nr:phage tail tape measure protein [Methylovulum sp.]